MNKKFITIFTPTYNRAYLLRNLYNSLLEQTDKDFNWIVVDDGSTDNTEELFNEFKSENKMDITYVKKQNAGKPSAINDGLDLSEDELFFIVDSDDYLTPNAIERIRYYYDQVKDKPNFIGVVGQRGDKDHKPYINYYGQESKKKNKYYDLEYVDADALEYRYKYKIGGDRAEVFTTRLLKNYRFPIIDNEKFIFETIVWNKIANDGYKQRWFNEVIYITEYQEDGLSKNIEKHLKNNPKSTLHWFNSSLKWKHMPFDERLSQCTKYYQYGMQAGKTIDELYKECNDKFLSLFAIPRAKKNNALKYYK